MELMRRLFFKYQNVIPNPPFKFRANVTGVKLCCNEISKKFFKQILGIVMGTNLAPILANIYLAMLEKELLIICKIKNIKWPILFKRFMG